MALFSGIVRHQDAARALQAAGNELPYAAATYLTRMASLTGYAVQLRMPGAFDRPTPFTVKRVATTRASKTSLRAMVGIPDSRDEMGRPTSEYMRPGALGAAARHQKKSEYLLSIMGHLPADWVMVPGSFMKNKLDGYGNVPGSYYKQVIRDLQIKVTKGPPKPRFAAAQKRATRMGVAAEFFAVGRGRNTLNKGGGWLPPGIYRRTGARGERLEQYFVFVPKAKYEQRLDIREVAIETHRLHAVNVWNASLTTVRARFAQRGAR